MAIVSIPSVLTPIPYHLNGAAASESPSAEVRGQLMTITPAMAQDLLKRRLPNRPISKARIKIMITDMREHKWVTNGEPIILTESLEILDGQHRLMAVVESGMTVAMMVVVGVDATAMPSIDQGHRRSGVDQLTMAAISNGVQLASTARWLCRYERGGMRQRACALRDRDIVAYVAARPSLAQALPVGRMVRDLLPQSIASMLFFVMSNKDNTQAERYFDDLAHGAGLKPDNPPYVIREKLLRDRSPKTHLAVANRGALLVLGWACLRHGRYLSAAVSWRGLTDAAVPFPAIV